jgi:predicted Zn finger-like uncharacterized protein
MTITCPRCGTVYRMPPRPEGAADATFRCANCRHVFEAEGEKPPVPEEDEDREEQFTLGEEETDDEAPDEVSAAPPRRRREDAGVRVEHAPEAEATPARFALRCLFVVTLGYAILSVYLYTHPTETRELLRRLPLIGPRLVETRLDPASVELVNVRGEFQRVQSDHLVFVVSGTAVNASAAPVKGIQIAAHVHGAEAQRQVVFCGGTPRDVRDLSLREIALLQTIEPPKDWALAPGEQTTFMVVFPSVAPDLREYGAEVVAVRAPKRGGA